MAVKHYDAVCVATEEDYEIARSFVSEERLFLTGPSKALASFEKSERAKEIRNEYVQRLGLVVS